MTSRYHVLTSGENPVIPAPEYRMDHTKLTPDSLTAVKNKWREMLVGNPTLNATDPRARRMAEQAGKRADQWLAQILTAPDTTTLFDGLVYTRPEDINIAYDRLHEMALGWATPGSHRYHDSSVLEAVRFSLQWLYSYKVPKTHYETPPGVYGENVKVFQEGNWWHWFIGIPISLTQTLLLLEDVLPPAFIKQVLEPFDFLQPLPTRKGSPLVSQGKACLLSALLQGQAERATLAIGRMFQVFEYVRIGDGFYVDGSFVQHVALGYVGGYGLSYVEKFHATLHVLAQSDFDCEGQMTMAINRLFTQFFDSFEPFLYKGTMMATMTGRPFVSREQLQLMVQLFHLVDFADEEHRRRFYAAVRYYEQNNPAYAELPDKITYAALAPYDRYRASGVPARTGYTFAHVFGFMDRVVQNTEKYTVALAISSPRHYRYEAINGANSDGWYMGDGVTYVYGSDKPAYENDAFRFLDRMRLPGVTMTTAPRTQQQFCVYTNPLNGDPFVGGVSDVGKYGVGVMKLAYNRSMPLANFSSDLVAHKAWFLFDREVVCVGTNITATNSAEIITVVEDRKLKPDSLIRLNGAPYAPGEQTDVREQVSYLTLDHFGGYYFPDSPTVYLREHVNTNRYLQLWLSHGESPTAAKYAYVLLPEMDEAGVAAYAASPEAVIVRNDDKVTAVRKVALGKTGYVFWAQDEEFFEGLKVSCPCALMKTEHSDGRLTFHISDPSQLQTDVVLTVGGRYRATAAGKRVSAVNQGELTVLTVDTARAYGASIEVTLIAV
ncbi:MAG: polysaccharide lyase family 8 super-sandwich domain-containing protein [Eubacteriales bacterium]